MYTIYYFNDRNSEVNPFYPPLYCERKKKLMVHIGRKRRIPQNIIDNVSINILIYLLIH